VPWVTSWSGERETGVSRCPSVDGQLAVGQIEKPGIGRPLYSQNHLFRQRRSVREMLCPMCGAPTPDNDRWSQSAQTTHAGDLRRRGYGLDLPIAMDDQQVLLNCGAVAPLHRTCAEASQTRCPHLGRMEDQRLKPFPAAWVILPLWIEAKAKDRVGASVRVVTFLQLLGVETSSGGES
jgi:hypothetical protein